MATTNLDGFLVALGRSSIEAGILVVVVLAAQWLFRRQLTPRWRCALWLLVMVRLLLPISFGSVTSIFNLLPHWTRSAAPPSATGASVRPATAFEPMPPSAAPVPPVLPIPSHSATGPPASSWPVWVFAIWLGGTVLLAGQVLVSSVRLRRRCARLQPVTRPDALAVLNQCGERLGLRIQLPLLETVAVSSPALYGLLRPRLLLPRGFTVGYSPTELRCVFLHELAHLKRRDLLLSWVVAALQAVHWFNPLVWIGFARWRADRELACDAMALEAAGDGQNKLYGRTILRLLENCTRPMATPGLVGILEDKRQLRRRIGMIANFAPVRGWPRLAALLVGVLAVVGLTDAQSGTGTAANAPGVKSTSANGTGSEAFQNPDPKAAAPSQLARQLTGAWIRVGTPSKVGEAPRSGGRIKFCADSHWCITQADPKTGVVIFHHGGTFALKGNEYAETVAYANPSTLNLIGQTNKFLVQIDGGTLTETEVGNPYGGVWKRLKTTIASSQLAKELTGTWVLAGGNPAPVERFKFCVDGHWCDTQADPKTGVVVVHHGGTYTLNGNDYRETVEYANPDTMSLIGHTFKFTLKIEGNTLTLKGIGNPWNEVWKRAD